MEIGNLMPGIHFPAVGNAYFPPVGNGLPTGWEVGFLHRWEMVRARLPPFPGAGKRGLGNGSSDMIQFATVGNGPGKGVPISWRCEMGAGKWKLGNDPFPTVGASYTKAAVPAK